MDDHGNFEWSDLAVAIAAALACALAFYFMWH